MVSVSRKERELQTRRAAILQAAGRVFAQEGSGRATIARIAREAEVGVGTIYQLFQNKDALTMALLEERAGMLLAQAEIEASARPAETGGVRKLAGIDLLFSEDRSDVWLGKTFNRREREAQSKRTEILDAAARVVVEKGFHGSAMVDITEEAGVATGTLYNFFPSKEELYLALIEEKADEFLLILQAEVNRVSPAVEKITRLIHAECAFFEANRTFFLIYVSTRSGFQWVVQEDLSQRIQSKFILYLGWVTGIIEAGIREGSLRDGEPREMARALVGMLNASMFGWMADGEEQSLAARAPRIVEFFLKGAQQP